MKHIKESNFLYENNNNITKNLKKTNMKSSKLKEQGVTMLSLVVTIIILLILSGITIKFALNDNGLIKQSALAVEKYKNSSIQEQVALNEAIKSMNSASSSSSSSSGSDSDDGENTDELIKQINDLQGQVKDLNGQISNLQDQVKDLNGQINNLKTKQATGNTTAAQVLAGATFSTSAGIGLTGTMRNNGAWTAATTGSGNIIIPAGYHNGQGYVSGAGAYNQGVADTKSKAHIKYVYHQHQSSCYKQCSGTLDFVSNTKPQESEYKCNRCGQVFYLGGGYGKWTNTQCQNVFLACGKTTSTIDSTTIEF